MDGKEIVREINIKLAEIGMTKTEFSRITGISRASISQWNSGAVVPSAESIAKINACLGTHFILQSSVSDNMYVTIQMLQELRDEDKMLLEVARDMTPEQVQIMMEFGKTLKRIGKNEIN